MILFLPLKQMINGQFKELWYGETKANTVTINFFKRKLTL